MSWTFFSGGYFLSWLLIPFILLRNKPPASTLAWIWAVILFPYIGPVAYLVFGENRLVRRRLRAGQQMSKARASGEKVVTEKTRKLVAELEAPARGLAELLSRINEISVTTAERVELHHGGVSFYAALIRAIEEAKHHVHICFYIYRNDARGQQLLDALVAAARRGVEVRLLLDGVGCLGTPKKFFRPLMEAGGKFAWFRTSRFLRLRWHINLRNHRKLQVIDGTMAFVGGMNLGREYAGEDPRIGPWRDLAIQIHGAAAGKLQAVFADDWYFATDEKLLASHYYPRLSTGAQLLVQPMPDGPDSNEDPIQMSIVGLLDSARKRAWLTCGYFVPFEPLLTALKLAAERGVDVRLLISEKTDHPWLVRVGRSYYEELLEHGVKLYEFNHAVNHAKCALLDERWVMVGSANFDIRSMRLNFELNCVARDEAAAKDLERELKEDFAHANAIELEEFRRRPFHQRALESALRPLAPLL
jgi:cardiolipin synthase A/B